MGNFSLCLHFETDLVCQIVLVGETESVLFGSKRKLKVKGFHIVCSGHTIESADHVKF